MQPVVDIRGLTKRFGEREVLRGLDLAVPAGVCFGLLGPNGAGKTTALRALLRLVELSDRADAPIATLSGGMKRRLTIARALINRPELIILDEPTTGLDPQVRRMIWARLRALRDQGRTLRLPPH